MPERREAITKEVQKRAKERFDRMRKEKLQLSRAVGGSVAKLGMTVEALRNQGLTGSQ